MHVIRKRGPISNTVVSKNIIEFFSAELFSFSFILVFESRCLLLDIVGVPEYIGSMIGVDIA
jgi:hypothetical protein